MDKKIKLVISDLHMGTGRQLPDGRINPAEDFVNDKALSDFLEYFSKEYRGYEIELIINGDAFDFLKAVGGIEYTHDITKEAVYRALERIIDGHPLFFSSLREFLKIRRHTVTFIVGNHDQPLLSEWVQKRVREVLERDVQFIPFYYQFDGVFVAHGHQYELIHRFNIHKLWTKDRRGREILNIPWGSYFVLEVLNPLKQVNPVIDKIKPFKNAIKWGLFFETWSTLKILFRLVWFYVRNRFLHPERERRLKFALNFTDMMDALFHRTLESNARRLLRRHDLHTVVFGHTHIPLSRVWGGKYYFNSGTWTENINLDLKSFGKSTPMSFVMFEYRAGRPYGRLLRWKGSYRPYEELVS